MANINRALADRVITFFGDNQSGFGRGISIDSGAQLAAIGVDDNADLNSALLELERAGLLRFHPETDAANGRQQLTLGHRQTMMLTLEGWQRYESLRRMNPARILRSGNFGSIGSGKRLRTQKRLSLARSLTIVAIIAVVAFGIPSVRYAMLRAAGWTLVASDPLTAADVIVVSLASSNFGVLEAADLVHERMANRVAVFEDPPSGEDYEFIRRGLPYEDHAARQIRQLGWLGVVDILQIPGVTQGTRSEADLLSSWSREHQFRSIIVVTTADHSHRFRRVLVRAMKGSGITVMVRSSRYSDFDPDHWWETYGGIQLALSEWLKLVVDVFRHPIPS
jgi:hypothetical protein